ncbi:MAG: chromate efflux transporter [Gemmatimonadaceae bacterium]
MPEPHTHVPFGEAVRAWTRIALQSFGGPAGQIAVIHRVVVDEKKWLDEPRFLHALSYCMLLPGPEAQQLVTYTGWLLHGVRGGLTAGLLFVLPGFLTILALSVTYALYQQTTLVTALFFGLKPAVVAIVVEAIVRLGKRALTRRSDYAIAAAAFLAIFTLAVPFPLIVVGAALLGMLREVLRPVAAGGAEGAAVIVRPRIGRLLRTTGIWLLVWSVPFLIIMLIPGRSPVLLQEAIFFSEAALVTFGGAYAVLAYLAQQAVHVYHWLSPTEMLDGLGLAETTPGPLIMVVQFVGFLGAYRSPGALSPLLAGVIGSVVTVWVTFAPCFLFIFAGAPYVEWLRGRRQVQAALRGIMAAVVGVVVNLALWFALHVAFGTVVRMPAGPLQLWVPDVSSVSWPAVGIAAVALVAVLRFRAGLFVVLLGGAALGLAAVRLTHP